MKKVLVLIVLLGIRNTVLLSQWKPIEDFPGPATDGAPSFVIGDKAYVGGGLTSNDFYSYDVSKDRWTQLNDLPGEFIRAWSFAFSIDGKGYICGGDTTGRFDVISDVYEYDPQLDLWTKKANLPLAMDGAFACSYKGKAYVFGGFDGQTAISTVYEYDPAKDIWTQKSDYPGGQAIFLSGFVIKDKIYVGLGSTNGLNGTTLFYQYDPNSDKWNQKASFIGEARLACIGFSVNGLGYIGGGENKYSQVFHDIYQYDPDADKWKLDSTAAMLESSCSAWSSSFVIKNTAFYGLGAKFTSHGIEFSTSFYRIEKPLNEESNNLK